jgi:predicted NBD/HSP70 family sugar kinase
VKAGDAINATARFMGIGLGTIVKAFNPDCIYLGGEITGAWDLIEKTVRAAMAERALTESTARTTLRVSSIEELPRLRGAAALIAAPTFAAPRVA